MSTSVNSGHTRSLRPACDRLIEARQATAMHWVLVAGDTPVSYSAIGAMHQLWVRT
ncbi:hypothetical protein [Nostoc sp. 'Peltigera malacea cyanobiont' DB3992]|uniref:hypothetical protein n=1 Tax=Nostoc sp. 'Peltigera malacea cyanobiont' DB3992 TaxID=1206980 RepID=UPI00211E3CB9|nr:hypothetical protein [Nostoc sp. 'Peltigera malacea cyanobiont' DB3992]